MPDLHADFLYEISCLEVHLRLKHSVCIESVSSQQDGERPPG
jgi:hypothetical protein